MSWRPRAQRPWLRCVSSQAHAKLTAMNDPAKGGSAYLAGKIVNARDALIEPKEEEPPKEAPKEAPKE